MKCRRLVAGLVCCPLFVLLMILCLVRAQIHQIQECAEYPVPTSIEDEENRETFMQLALWDTLNDEAKQCVLQRIADIEATYLGTPRVIVTISELPIQTVACYCDYDHRITVNSLHLGDMEKTVIGVLHESRHVWQHRVCEVRLSEEQQNLLLFRDIVQMRCEITNYIHGSDDLTGYYFQLIESDSRAYAEDRFTTVYLSHLPAVS